MNNAEPRSRWVPKIQTALQDAFRISSLVSDPAEMDRNLRQKPSKGEFIGLLIGILTIALTVWYNQNGYTVLIDYTYFTDSAGGVLDHYYLGFWIMPVFGLLRLLPVPVGYAL